MLRKALFFFLKVVIPLIVGIYLFWYFFSSMSDKSKELFYKALSEANYFWIFLSLIVGMASYYSRAYRWKYALEPIGYRTISMNRFYAVMIGYVVNLTIPRAGEASRAVMLNRSDSVPFTAGFGTIISERLVDMFFLGMITIVAFVIGQNDFIRIKDIIELEFGTKSGSGSSYFWIFLISVFLILSILFAFQKIRLKIFMVLKELYQSAMSIFKMTKPAAYIAHSIFIWICFLVMFWLPFLSFEETKSLSLSCVLLAFIAGSIGISLTNGGIGSYPLLVGLVVAYFLDGIPKDEAFAIGNALGLVVWVSQTMLLIIVGLVSWLLIPKKESK